MGNNLDCNWPKHGTVDGFFQQILDETWQCFLCVLWGVARFLEHCRTFRWNWMVQKWLVREGLGNLAKLLYDSRSCENCIGAFLKRMFLPNHRLQPVFGHYTKSPPNKIAQMHGIHRKTHHEFWEYISHYSNQPEIAKSLPSSTPTFKGNSLPVTLQTSPHQTWVPDPSTPRIIQSDNLEQWISRFSCQN